MRSHLGICEGTRSPAQPRLTAHCCSLASVVRICKMTSPFLDALHPLNVPPPPSLIRCATQSTKTPQVVPNLLLRGSHSMRMCPPPPVSPTPAPPQTQHTKLAGCGSTVRLPPNPKINTHPKVRLPPLPHPQPQAQHTISPCCVRLRVRLPPRHTWHDRCPGCLGTQRRAGSNGCCSPTRQRTPHHRHRHTLQEEKEEEAGASSRRKSSHTSRHTSRRKQGVKDVEGVWRGCAQLVSNSISYSASQTS
jgi:hypothetical protein